MQYNHEQVHDLVLDLHGHSGKQHSLLKACYHPCYFRKKVHLPRLFKLPNWKICSVLALMFWIRESKSPLRNTFRIFRNVKLGGERGVKRHKYLWIHHTNFNSYLTSHGSQLDFWKYFLLREWWHVQHERWGWRACRGYLQCETNNALDIYILYLLK